MVVDGLPFRIQVVVEEVDEEGDEYEEGDDDDDRIAEQQLHEDRPPPTHRASPRSGSPRRVWSSPTTPPHSQAACPGSA